MAKVPKLIGATVMEIRPMTREELVAEGWLRDASPPVIVLSTKAGQRVLLYPSHDEEGNGPGALFGKHAGDAFIVIGEEEVRR